MKKICLLIQLSLCCTELFAQIQNITGKWEGKFAGQLTMVFHFIQRTDTLSGSIDSPDQGAFGIPLSRITLTKDSVLLKTATPAATFKGIFINDTTLNGVWLQGAAILPLVLKKKQEAGRPQLPKAPFPYASEEVEYDNTDKTIHFGATYTYPKTGGPFATAILITGSGQEDRDETVAGHKPFAVIADYLTRNGYAVLRIDDRGVGKSTGFNPSATSEDFAKDIATAIDYLKTRKESDPRKTGLIGHSEGGLVADITGTIRPEDVHFIISLAGPGTKGAAVLADQNEAIWLKHGAPAVATRAYRQLFYQLTDPITLQSDSASIYTQTLRIYQQWKKTQPDSVLMILGLYNEGQSAQLFQKMTQALSGPWMKYFLSVDPGMYIQQLHCKYLALNGAQDIQVAARTNLDGIEAAIKKSNISSYAVKELPGLNHLFQHCRECTVGEYSQLEETFAPEALEAMKQWLDAHVK